MNHFVFKYSWIISIISSAFMGGMIWLGIMNSETQSTNNGNDIVALRIDVAGIKQEVDDISKYLGVPKK